MRMTEPLGFVFGGSYDRLADVDKLSAEHGLPIRTRLLPSPKDAFSALRDDPDLAGGEMSVSFYMTERSRLGGAADLVALPVWVSRAFRHSNVYVREDSEFHSPEDLRGRRIGLPEYGMTMAVWLRGLFADEYGIKPSDIRWVAHRPPAGLGTESVIYPADVDIATAPPGLALHELLLRGDIDAWIGAGVAPPLPGVRRLFDDVHAVERDYFRRTSVFPVMHVLVMRRALLSRDEGLAQAVFDIFNEAKLRAQRRLWSTSVSYPTLPWTLAAVEEQTRFMGKDPWPYGLEANQPTLRTLLRYMEDQGLLWGHLDLPDYFLPLEPQG
ncbi:4,5-dihydroxyphthalate decarboxylase [Streptomyces sp. MnatMP-M17]|nr:4,5-dihydroxyphthalate decarboxylase [Streptomyces sp. MnatMP-M17]